MIGPFDTKGRTLVIAEVGNNHEGDFDLARQMVALAAECGADAVKFQTFRAEAYVARHDAARFERLRRFQLTPQQFGDLAEDARRHGVMFISTPFDLDSVAVLAEIADAIKVSSGDNTFHPLLDAVAATRLPVILSTGLAGETEIAYALQRIAVGWHRRALGGSLGLLHCVSSYPTEPHEANLSAITALARLAPGATVGYSDHTAGTLAAILAVAAGARIVEKHFTIDKNHSDFRDHQLSADPADLRALIAGIREAERMLGDGHLDPRPSEAANTIAMRRSIAAARDLPVGHVLTGDDIVWVRPGTGLPPGEEPRLLGRRLTVPVAAGDAILPATVT